MAVAGRLVIMQLMDEILFQPERQIVDRSNPLEFYTEDEVFARFRFRPATIMHIVAIFEDQLMHLSRRNSPLTPLLQVLVFLRFLATGSFQIVVGDTLSVSQPTVSRCCRRVGRLIANACNRYITFGGNMAARKHHFMRIAGFPNVVGCVDGTHVKIARPTRNEAEFVNRKGYHSINVQMICDADFLVTNLVAKWPGSTHDARIWRESQIKQEFENGIYNGVLLGDSGYACKPYMLTPFLNPTTRPQERFNTSLCRTRVLIEQTFGIIKKRFPILHFGIRSEPEKAVQYIASCVILHNIGITQGDIVEHDQQLIEYNPPDHHIDLNEPGNHIRQQIVNNFFT